MFGLNVDLISIPYVLYGHTYFTSLMTYACLPLSVCRNIIPLMYCIPNVTKVTRYNM